MKLHRRKIGATALMLALMTTSRAWAVPNSNVPVSGAQPDEANTAKQVTPATPEMKDKTEVLRRTEQGLRRLMTDCGFSDRAIQDMVIAHMRDEVQARRPLREYGVRLYRVLRSTEASDEQVSRLLAEFRAAVQSDKDRHAATTGELDARLGYTRTPRLEAMLVLFGITGDYPGVLPLGNPRPAQAARNVRRLEREKEELARQNESLKLARESLQSEKDNLLRERDNLKRELEALRRERDRLKKENEKK